MYRDQRRAIEARTQTSWGSRMQERRRMHDSKSINKPEA
jgi:voltage-gated chloride channel